MTARRQKLREFFIYEPQWDQGLRLNADSFEIVAYLKVPDLKLNSGWLETNTKFREVSPDLDKTIESLVELVKKAVSKNHSWPTNELQDYQEWIAKWINDSRAALKEIERMKGE